LATLWAWHRGCAAAIVNSTTFLASSRDSILQVPIGDEPPRPELPISRPGILYRGSGMELTRFGGHLILA
jgi:hypothetical protein